MRQRLKNINYKKMIIAATIVAAIIIVSLIFAKYQKDTKRKENLQNLKLSTEKASNDFEKKYSELTEEQKEALKENFQDFIDKFFKKGSAEEFQDYDEIKQQLGELPSNYAEVLQRDDIYSMLFGKCQKGQECFDSFIAESRLGNPGSVIMAQFTTNLDPIYYWIEFDGNSYHVVEDKTRDGYDEETGYVEMYGRYLKVETYKNDDETYSEYGYITDNSTLNYKEIQEYFEQVEAGAEHLIEPQFIEFYMANYTQEEYEQRILTPDRVSKEFISQYSGYADLHPSFAEGNPMDDYDGDGILDRIYREYQTLGDGKSMVNVYCFLGNGKNVTLSRNCWGELFKTEIEDITNDEKKDICFIQYTDTASKTEYGLTVFEYKKGNYVATKLPVSKFESLDIITDEHGNKKIQGIVMSDTQEEKESVLISYEDENWEITDRKVVE